MITFNQTDIKDEVLIKLCLPSISFSSLPDVIQFLQRIPGPHQIPGSLGNIVDFWQKQCT